MHGLSMNSHPGRWYIVENAPSPRFFYSFSMIIPFWATSSLPLSFSLKSFLMLATVHMITFQLPLSLERCLVFYQSTEKLMCTMICWSFGLPKMQSITCHSCVCSMVHVLRLLFLLFFSSVRSLISPGSNTGCIVMYQDNPILDDNSKLKLACHVW